MFSDIRDFAQSKVCFIYYFDNAKCRNIYGNTLLPTLDCKFKVSDDLAVSFMTSTCLSFEVALI